MNLLRVPGHGIVLIRPTNSDSDTGKWAEPERQEQKVAQAV